MKSVRIGPPSSFMDAPSPSTGRLPPEEAGSGDTPRSSYCLETKRMLRVRPCHENAEIDILPSYLHPISYHKVGNV